MENGVNAVAIAILSTTLAVSCAHAPAAGSQESTPLEDLVVQAAGAPTPLAIAADASTAVRQADEASFRALKRCQQVSAAIPLQQIRLSRISYDRKQAGLLVTTAIGVAGSIVTAVLAYKDTADMMGTVSKKGAVAGASTAGAAAVAGVVSLFVVGTGTDGESKVLSDNSKQIADGISAFRASCEVGKIKDGDANSCKLNANLLHDNCDTIARDLPWEVPDPDVPSPPKKEKKMKHNALLDRMRLIEIAPPAAIAPASLHE